jgi:hypothetical protein
MTTFRPFSNPATGERTEYTAIAEGNGGEVVRFRVLGLVNPMMRALIEMACEFDEPFVLDRSSWSVT